MTKSHYFCMNRGNIFTQGEIFHIFNKSIAKYGIFKDLNNCQRFIQALDYYNNHNYGTNLGNYLKKNKNYFPQLLDIDKISFLKFISYCVMPDHYHLVIKILKESILSKYINDLANSYTRYFNFKFDRKGPLWQNNFKAVRIETNEQLLHVVRYININPTTEGLVKKPEDWKYSSYRDLISNPKYLKDIITEISISDPKKFKKFCENNIDYQKKLRAIKKLLLE